MKVADTEMILFLSDLGEIRLRDDRGGEEVKSAYFRERPFKELPKIDSFLHVSGALHTSHL